MPSIRSIWIPNTALTPSCHPWPGRCVTRSMWPRCPNRFPLQHCPSMGPLTLGATQQMVLTTAPSTGSVTSSNQHKPELPLPGKGELFGKEQTIYQARQPQYGGRCQSHHQGGCGAADRQGFHHDWQQPVDGERGEQPDPDRQRQGRSRGRCRGDGSQTGADRWWYARYLHLFRV